MSCIIISTDWRFKEKFKTRFTRSFLREFSLAGKLVQAVKDRTVSETDCIVMDEKLGSSTQRTLLLQLEQAQNEATVFLFTEKDEVPAVGFPVRTVRRNAEGFGNLFDSIESEFAGAFGSAEQGPQYHGDCLVGSSSRMQEVRRQLALYAKTSCSIHLAGETGTGKEIVAQAIHFAKFPARKIVSINCSLLDSPIGDSIFFGHAKGAFTDGKAEVHGLVEEANGSTLFLDEIENMSVAVQANLLRLLETGLFRRLGDPEERHSDFRLVTASNEDLERLVEQGQIRKDFFYRISDVTIRLPPLREHKEDIPELARYYLDKNFPGKQLSKEDLLRLDLYSWPGNVRQLFSVLKRSAIRSGERQDLDLSAEEFA